MGSFVVFTPHISTLFNAIFIPPKLGLNLVNVSLPKRRKNILFDKRAKKINKIFDKIHSLNLISDFYYNSTFLVSS
jgi:hypothetical protein